MTRNNAQSGREPVPADHRRRAAEALADPTRFTIHQLVAGAEGPLDVATIVEAVGVHHTSVRAHLAKLRDAGLVLEATAAPAGRGRPRLTYRRSEATTASPARDPYRELASLLASAVADGADARVTGRRHGARLAADSPSSGAVALIEREADELGFAPRRDGTSHRVDLVLQSCPFAEVAVQDPSTVCALHLGLAEGIAEHAGDVEVLGMVVRDPRRAGCRLQLRTAIGSTSDPIDHPIPHPTPAPAPAPRGTR